MANKIFSSLAKALNIDSESQEVKQLKTRIDNMIGEQEDLRHYEMKFLDSDVSNFTGSQLYEMPGVDQIVRPEQLLRMYATETWVYIAVSAIAKSIAALPPKLEKRTKVAKQVTNAVTGQLEMMNTDVWVDASSGPLFDRFQYPNKFTTRTEFIMMLVIDLLTVGEYYVYLESDEDLTTITSQDDINMTDPTSPFGRLRAAMATADTPIKGMYRIPPNLMKPVPSEDGFSIEGYAIDATTGSYAYNAAEIIHVKLPNPTNPLQGLSPLIAAFKSVLLDRFTSEHMIRFYKSGARLGGVVTTEKQFSNEQLARFQRSFENNYTGRQNHHRTLILPPGMKYETIEQNPAETALLDFCKYNREAILSVYNVPPIKAGVLDNANYANALVQLKQFFTDTVIPYLGFLEDGFNLKNTLMPDSRSFRFKFDLSQVEALKENFKEQAETAVFMIKGGLSFNEVRARAWNLGPVKDGDKVQAIEQMKSGSGGGGLGLFGASAQHGDEKGDGSETNPEQGLLAGMPGPVVTSVMNVLGRVGRGRLDKEAAFEMLHAIHGIPKNIAARLLGMPEPAPAPAPEKNADQSDSGVIAATLVPTTGTLSQRVAQLVHLFMERDKLPLTMAVANAITQATLEGFSDTPAPEEAKDGPVAATQVDGSWKPIAVGTECPKCNKVDCICPPEDKPGKSLEDFITEALAKLDPKENVTAEFLTELVEIYKQTYSAAVINKEGEIQQTQAHSFGITKEIRAQMWKSFIEKTDPMVIKRHQELVGFFAKVKAIIMSKLGANIREKGLHATRTKEDEKDILSGPEFEKLIADYIKEADKSLKEALDYGFGDTLTSVVFDVPNADALKALQKYLASKIDGIVGTTQDQMREVLSDAFERELPMAEVSKAITEKFQQIDTGRAQTIARTETLTAVSIGRDIKRQEYKNEFPEKKLSKGWVSAEDDRVRDSHADLDGVFIDVDDTFDNGCKFPRDPDGDAEEVINCRCTDITVETDDVESVSATLNDDEGSDDQDT